MSINHMILIWNNLSRKVYINKSLILLLERPMIRKMKLINRRCEKEKRMRRRDERCESKWKNFYII